MEEAERGWEGSGRDQMIARISPKFFFFFFVKYIFRGERMRRLSFKAFKFCKRSRHTLQCLISLRLEARRLLTEGLIFCRISDVRAGCVGEGGGERGASWHYCFLTPSFRLPLP